MPCMERKSSARDIAHDSCEVGDEGRLSIDPELLLRILLIGYLYGITIERKLVEELRMHLARMPVGRFL
jgi:transposase